MTELFWKIAAGAAVTAVLGTAVRTRAADLGTVLSLAACAVLAAAAVQLFSGVSEGLGRLLNLSGLEPALFAPVLKVCGIGLLTQLCCAFCRESGESAAAKAVELGGNAAALCAALPLLNAVIELAERMLGG